MFISLCANANNMDSNPCRFNSLILSCPQKTITLQHETKESSIAAANNQGAEIYNLNDKNDSYYGYAIDSNSKLTKLIQQILISKNNNIFMQSHNISPNFKNEICTRAP